MNWAFRQHWLVPAVQEAVQALKPLAAEVSLTVTQFALAWVLREPNVGAAIIGASRPEQIDENVAASAPGATGIVRRGGEDYWSVRKPIAAAKLVGCLGLNFRSA